MIFGNFAKISEISMRIDIISAVPELLDSPLSHSIVGRAIKKGLVEIHVHNLRKYGIRPFPTSSL